MSRSLVLLAAGLVLLFSNSCGDEVPPPLGAGVEDVAPEAPAEPERLSRLERLHLEVRICVTVGGPGVEDRVRRIYREILDQHDPDDREARRFLGYTDFQADVLGRLLEYGEDPIPEAIAHRKGYDFLDDLVDLHRRRWLRTPEETAHARDVVAAMREHGHRLVEDRLYRLGDAARANLATDRDLRGYCYATAWRPPYLVCYLRGDELSDFDLLKVTDWRRRQAVRRERRMKRRALRPAAEAIAQSLEWLEAELLRRYGERHGLKPLHAPYGGRPDHKPGVRSYPDGAVLRVLVFEDQRAFQEFHIGHRGGPRDPAQRGYYLPTDRCVYTFDTTDDREGRDRRIRNLFRLGTYQQLAWYACQKNKWGAPAWGQEFLGAGLAGDLSAVRIGEDGAIEHTGLNVDLLGDAQHFAARFRERDQPYPLRPLEELTSVTRYRELTDRPRWRTEQGDLVAASLLSGSDWGTPRDVVLRLYFQQSWMFVRFLQDYDAGRYRESFACYLEAWLSRQTQHGMAQQCLQRCLGIEPQDWTRLDEEFRGFVEELLKRELP